MKITIATVLAFALALGLGPAAAQDDSEQTVRKIYFDHVKPDQRAEFYALSKDWNDCLAANDAGYGWSAWRAETGRGHRYAFVVDGTGWARFDHEDPAHEKCYKQLEKRYTATIESAHSQFDTQIESASHHVEGDFKVALVVNFNFNNPRKFFENAEKFTAAAKEANFPYPYYWWRTRGGNTGASHYLVIPRENFAAFDDDADYWTAVSSQLGEEAVARMREENRQAIDHAWDEIWVRDDELSYEPAE